MSTANGANIVKGNFSVLVDPGTTPNLSGGLMYTWYTHSGGVHPANTTEFDTLIQNAIFGGNGYHDGIVSWGSGGQALRWGGNAGPYPSYLPALNGLDNYAWVGTGQIFIPQATSYDFVIDGDDAVEFWVNGTNVSSWYGGHGFGSGASIGTLSFASAGWYPLMVRMEEIGGGDGVAIAYKRTADATFVTVPASNLRPYYIQDKASRVTTRYLGSGLKTDNSILQFNGTNNNINATTSLINRTNGQEITVSCWIKPGRTAGQYTVFCGNRSNDTNTLNWAFYQHTNDGAISFHGANQNKSSYVPTVNVWVNVANTVTAGGVSTLYVNGVSNSVVTGYTYGGAPGRLGIGANPGLQEPLLGDMAEVIIYDRALTAAEIQQNFNAIRGRYGI
jgi:hypothetical protein